MFSDAVEDRLADENPFARLGLTVGGREDIVVLTRDEVHQLAHVARTPRRGLRRGARGTYPVGGLHLHAPG